MMEFCGMGKSKKEIEERSLWILRFISFGVTILICLVIFYCLKLAPLGDNSIAVLDAYYQYMDFMAFFKDVLSGKQNLSYTMAKGLGSSAIGIFSYYLSSPAELLQLFFAKDQMPLSYDISVILKLGISSLTMTWFLQERFDKKITMIPLLGLSIGYGLMNYNFYQAWNTIWLDGVYMLPLMMLGVYRVIHTGAIAMLSVSTALVILFNWYIGGINCLFSGFWFLAEESLQHFRRGRTKKEFLHDMAIYVFGMLAGILISSVLFLPTVLQLRQGAGNSFDWNQLSLGFQGDVLASLGSYFMGHFVGTNTNTANLDYMSLFCGSVPVCGALSLFAVKDLKKKYKIFAFLLIAFAFLMFHWQILFFMFSLMKSPVGFIPRYSYLGCFILIFLSGYYFSNWERWRFGKRQLLICLTFSISQVFIEQIKPAQDIHAFFISISFLVIISLLIYAIGRLSGNSIKRRFMSGILMILAIWEMGIAGFVFLSQDGYSSLSAFKSYDNQQRAQIQTIKDYDRDMYRINQITSRYDIYVKNAKVKLVGKNCNEAMNFSYWGIQEFSSFLNQSSFQFLSDIGYYGKWGKQNVFYTSIIPADSLLGVKYVLSPETIKGLAYIPSFGIYNEKKVYENPYVLPMAFVYQGNEQIIPSETDNPFTYTNAIYSKLMGKPVFIYRPSAFKYTHDYGHEIYNVKQGSGPLYAYLIWGRKYYIPVIFSAESKNTLWSSGMFYIPENISKIDVSLPAEQPMESALFYEIDLSALKEISREINQRAAKNITIRDGEISGTVEGREGDILFLSIPYEKVWTVMRNGKEITPDIFAGCLMNIPLEEGENHIQMTYHIPGLTLGAFMTIAGIVILAGTQYKRRKE